MDDQINASSSSCDEIASQPFTNDPMIINQRRRFTKRCLIATVGRDESLHPAVTPQIRSFKCSSSRRKNWPVDFRQIRLLYFFISCVVWFWVFLTHFCVQGLLEIKVWLKERGEFTSWTSIFIFGNLEWKAMHLAINWVISKANLD